MPSRCGRAGRRLGDRQPRTCLAHLPSSPPELTGKVVLLTPAEAKGLEFDMVVIADPEAILAADPHGPNDLYVAMTRATQRLGVVHPGPVPRELSSLRTARNHGTFTTPEWDISKPVPPAVQVTPPVADTHLNAPTSVVSP